MHVCCQCEHYMSEYTGFALCRVRRRIVPFNGTACPLFAYLED
ncbi:MAG TPA: hypothetical protein PK718_04545 [Candidatus Methanofastidiosa archaeon]|nr:hypothetical protein [Candidatus Methanofastidiosa archaeon]